MNKQLALDIRLGDDATFANYVGIASGLILQHCHWSFVWGASGSGRSHLLQACCHHYGSSIYLSNLSSLSPDVLNGLEAREMICIDDVEEVLSDGCWQEALLHLMNRVKDRQHRLIIAAGKPAQLLSVTLKDLHSRLIAARSIETDRLTDEQKLKVLMMRAKRRGFEITQEVGQFVLRHNARNMRDLVNLLDNLDEETLRQGKKVTIPFVKQIQDLMVPPVIDKLNRAHPPKRIFFTGGGSAGHVTPNLALIEALQTKGWQISYVGTRHGIERTLTENLDMRFFSISSGKLRRYFDWQNFIDPFLVVWGIVQSLGLCLRHRPHLVFSKGGFVAMPLVIGAWICRIPVLSHESDIMPGLANKLSFPFCKHICVNFPETKKYLPAGKTIVTGSPIRRVLLEGSRTRGKRMLGFSGAKPILLIMGGSLGAAAINQAVRGALDALLSIFQVVHLVGGGNLSTATNRPGYLQFEYLDDDFGDVLAAADFALSRAGANAIYELLRLKIPHLLIPLSIKASRGDQLVNAKTFAAAGLSLVLEEEHLSAATLLAKLNLLVEQKSRLRLSMARYPMPDALTTILDLINSSTDISTDDARH